MDPPQRRDALIGVAVVAVIGVLFALTLRADRAATLSGSAQQIVVLQSEIHKHHRHLPKL